MYFDITQISISTCAIWLGCGLWLTVQSFTKRGKETLKKPYIATMLGFCLAVAIIASFHEATTPPAASDASMPVKK